MARNKLDIPKTSINLEELFTEPIIVDIPGPKLVSVLPKRDFHCKIAGVWYYFYKGKSQRVPESVERALQRDPTKLG